MTARSAERPRYQRRELAMRTSLLKIYFAVARSALL